MTQKTPESSEKPDTDKGLIDSLLEIMEMQEVKNPVLAQKQRRLLEILRQGTNNAPRPD